MKAATAAGGLAAAGYVASTVAASNSLISGSSDCGGSSDDGSGCVGDCDDSDLDQAFRDLSYDDGVWESVSLEVYQKSFQVTVNAIPATGKPNNCRVTERQLTNGQTWTRGINILSNKVTPNTRYVTYLVFNFDSAEAAYSAIEASAAAESETDPFYQVYFDSWGFQDDGLETVTPAGTPFSDDPIYVRQEEGSQGQTYLEVFPSSEDGPISMSDYFKIVLDNLCGLNGRVKNSANDGYCSV
jgi:hypothetical protein